jgi:hypothetical protein
VKRARQVLKVIKVIKELLDLQGNKVPRVQLELLVIKAFLVRKARKVIKD